MRNKKDLLSFASTDPFTYVVAHIEDRRDLARLAAAHPTLRDAVGSVVLPADVPVVLSAKEVISVLARDEAAQAGFWNSLKNVTMLTLQESGVWKQADRQRLWDAVQAHLPLARLTELDVSSFSLGFDVWTVLLSGLSRITALKARLELHGTFNWEDGGGLVEQLAALPLAHLVLAVDSSLAFPVSFVASLHRLRPALESLELQWDVHEWYGVDEDEWAPSTGEILAAARGLPLTGLSVPAITDGELAQLQGMPLESLSVGETGGEMDRFSDGGLAVLGTLSRSLTSLRLELHPGITDDGLTFLSELPRLRELSLVLHGAEWITNDTLTRVRGILTLEDVSLFVYSASRVTNLGLKELSEAFLSKKCYIEDERGGYWCDGCGAWHEYEE